MHAADSEYKLSHWINNRIRILARAAEAKPTQLSVLTPKVGWRVSVEGNTS